MVLLENDSPLVRHRGPSRRALTAVGAVGVAAVLTGAALLVTAYAEHPPWAPDIAYEAGYVKAKRIRGYDLHGDLVPALLAGGCAREAQDTEENPKAGHDPQRWTRGCLDGAAGRPSRHQGLAY